MDKSFIFLYFLVLLHSLTPSYQKPCRPISKSNHFGEDDGAMSVAHIDHNGMYDETMPSVVSLFPEIFHPASSFPEPSFVQRPEFSSMFAHPYKTTDFVHLPPPHPLSIPDLMEELNTDTLGINEDGSILEKPRQLNHHISLPLTIGKINEAINKKEKETSESDEDTKKKKRTKKPKRKSFDQEKKKKRGRYAQKSSEEEEEDDDEEEEVAEEKKKKKSRESTPKQLSFSQNKITKQLVGDEKQEGMKSVKSRDSKRKKSSDDDKKEKKNPKKRKESAKDEDEKAKEKKKSLKQDRKEKSKRSTRK